MEYLSKLENRRFIPISTAELLAMRFDCELCKKTMKFGEGKEIGKELVVCGSCREYVRDNQDKFKGKVYNPNWYFKIKNN